ncbi:MAG: DUF3054 domain-containing protein [Acidimicrobiales bacterium]
MGRRWLIVDALAVMLFVGIGRSAHHHAMTLPGMVSTTWPFAAGLAIGWACVIMGRRDGAAPASGVAIWLCTVGAGMMLRVWAGQGTAFAFILVTLGFLGAFMLGLRFVAMRLRRRGSVTS